MLQAASEAAELPEILHNAQGEARSFRQDTGLREVAAGDPVPDATHQQAGPVEGQERARVCVCSHLEHSGGAVWDWLCPGATSSVCCC